MKTSFLIIVILYLHEIALSQTVTCIESELNSDWQCIGPFQYNTNDLGRVISLWVDPDDSDHILAGTRSSGLWKTIDGGDNWSNLTGYSLPACGVKSIAVKPDNTDIIYIATMFDGSDLSFYNIGLAYSTDGGDTWQYDSSYPATEQYGTDRKNLTTGQELRFNPGNLNELFILAGSGLYKKNLTSGLWYGLIDVEPSGESYILSEIDINPTDNQNIVITPYSMNSPLIKYTLNGGASWNDLALPSVVIPTGFETYFLNASSSFSLDGSKFFVVVRGVATHHDELTGVDTQTQFHLYFYEFIVNTTELTLSKTYNHNFETVNNYNGFTDLMLLPGHTNRCLIGRSQGHIYYADIPSFGSTLNFIECSSGSDVHIDIRDMKLWYNSATGEDYVFAATDGGISKLSDLTGTISDTDWENINGTGLIITESLSLSNSEFQNLEYQTVGPDGNNYLAKDGLFSNNVGGDGSSAAISKTHDNLLLYTTNNGSVDAAPNLRVKIIGIWGTYGTPLNPKSNGIDSNERFSFSQQPVKFQHQTDFVWTGTTDVFVNEDAFRVSPMITDWVDISKSYYSHIDFGDIINADVFTTSPISAFDFIENYSATLLKRIYYSTIDKRTSESDIKLVRVDYEQEPTGVTLSSFDITPITITGESSGYNQIDYSWVSDIVIDKSNPDRLWISFGGMDVRLQNVYSNSDNAKNGRVYFSSNSGESWTNISEGLPDYPVLDLCYWDNSDDIIFAGTDVGVYVWNATEEEWQCFDTDDKMPYASVNELEINYCTMTLRASAYGFGIWETPLPIGTHFSRPGAPALEITSDITWTQSNDVGRDIRIKPGATLTIQNCEIRMPKEHRIIVERGAALILDSATLINYCEPWSGIEVWGNTSKPHPLVANVIAGTYPSALDDQGVVYLKNESKIVNAETGISTYKTTPEGNDAVYNGGIIIAEDASFINNQLVMRFMPYDYPVGGAYDTDDDNISYFKNCVFNINSAYLFDNYSNYQVFLWDVDGIDFLGCDFTNELLQADVTERGEAIYSVDATYTVSNFCTDILSLRTF